MVTIKKIFAELISWYDVWGFIGVLYLMIETNTRFFKTPEIDQNVLMNYLEWFAIFYAIALSVIVGETWRRYNQINSEIDREADSLKLLVHTSRIFPSQSLSDRLVQAVYAYAVCVLKLEGTDARTMVESHKKMNLIQQRVYDLILNTKDRAHEVMKAELLRQYCDAYDARGDRFDLLAQRMPAQIWLILCVFSLAWLWGFLWLKIHEATMSRYIVGCTTWAIGYMFYMARDLNNPARGSWRLDFRPFINNLF